MQTPEVSARGILATTVVRTPTARRTGDSLDQMLIGEAESRDRDRRAWTRPLAPPAAAVDKDGLRPYPRPAS